MRVRLMIDTEIPDKDIEALGELIVHQPPTWVEINSPHVGVQDVTPVPYGGRLMGAMPVEGMPT